VNPRTRQLVLHSEESNIVRQICEQAATGEKATEIARWLNDRGHRTKGTARKPGGLWTGRTVQLLRNPVYLGKRRVDGELITGAHEALIDQETAARVDAAIGGRRTTKSRSRQRLLSYSYDPYMLRGIF
jgi:Recombinase